MISHRKIIHIDMDCFYVAVEMRDNPSLKNKAVAVGGPPDKRGVIATANYLAREYGVRSAMSSHKALKLCPSLIILPGNFQKYKAESLKIRHIFSKYTDLVEAISLDEAYLDVTDCPQFDGIATRIARSLREDIFNITHLTASAGIAPNKFLAKIASDWKKPNGQFTIPPEHISEFLKNLPVSRIHGVGKVTTAQLHSLGIETCSDLQSYDTLALIRHFGKWGPQLKNLSQGIDPRPVLPSRERKSLAAEITFEHDLQSEDELREHFKTVFLRFQKRWETSGCEAESIKTFSVKIKLFNFELKTSDKRIKSGLPTEQQFLEMLLHLWKSDPQPVRLIGLGVSLDSEKTNQLSLSYDLN